MQPSNVLFIFSARRNRDGRGCYAHAELRTPQLDALAGRGAFDTSPIPGELPAFCHL